MSEALLQNLSPFLEVIGVIGIFIVICMAEH